MNTPMSKDMRYDRCPRCGTVIRFKSTDASTSCENCGIKINRLKYYKNKPSRGAGRLVNHGACFI